LCNSGTKIPQVAPKAYPIATSVKKYCPASILKYATAAGIVAAPAQINPFPVVSGLKSQ